MWRAMISRPAVQHGTNHQSESENYYFHIHKTCHLGVCHQIRKKVVEFRRDHHHL